MPNDVNSNDPRFVEYYAEQSMSAETTQRSQNILRTIIRMRKQLGDSVEDLYIADVGCNAGTQSRVWLEQGHRVSGADISSELVDLARERNRDFGGRASFVVGSASDLPWDAGTFDVCLMPELLEHVEDWRACLTEAVRVLKPGGSVFLSTTNVLCPMQNEYSLPLFSWYPNWLKLYFLRRTLTDKPELANYATFPALHWFSPYQLKRVLNDMGVDTLDRFDLISPEAQNAVGKLLIRTAKALPPARFLGHVLSPSSIVLGRKN